MLLTLRNVSKRFGGLLALNDVSLQIAEREIVGLIGPNGAGKTTLFNVISGFFRPETGSITFCGKEVAGWRPHSICRLGMCRTFQHAHPLTNLSVLTNVTVAGLTRVMSVRKAEEAAEGYLDQVGLLARKDVRAEALTLGGQRRLELARALATQPQLLLLDEVMTGLTPIEIKEVADLIRMINRQGCAVFMIEHVMAPLMALSQRVVVLNYGKKISEGLPGEVSRDPAVLKAYLGEDYGHVAGQ